MMGGGSIEKAIKPIGSRVIGEIGERTLLEYIEVKE